MNQNTRFFKPIIYLLLLTFPFSFFPADQSVPLASDESKTCLQKVADINMRSFPWKEDFWEANSFVEYVTKYHPRRLNPQPNQKRKNAYALFEEIEKRQAKNSFIALNNDEGIWLDLELFTGKKPGLPFLAEIIDRTATEYGKVKFSWMLAQSTDHAEFLMHRQNIIKSLCHDTELAEKLSENLRSMQKTENVFLSFWEPDSLKQQCDRREFPIKALNESKSALFLAFSSTHVSNVVTLSLASMATATLTLYGLLRVIGIIDGKTFDTAKKDYQGSGGFFLSYVWKKMEQRWPENRAMQALLALASAVACGWSIKGLWDDTRGSYLIDRLFNDLVYQLSQTMNALRDINHLIGQHPVLSVAQEFEPLRDLFTSKNKKIIEFLELMESGTLRKKPSFLSHKGVILRSFMLMHEIKNDLVLAINAAAELDVYCSFAKLHQEFSSKRVHWCFADYVQHETPMVDAVNFWHPVVHEDVVVPNSVQLGTNGKAPNMVITGPNAGGKSTILKSLALCILLSQTFGMAPAERFMVTPFTSIATYLNITDDIGSGNSLYKAEVLRVVELMKRIDNLEAGKFSFALFDEVFNGTSPHEGSAAAYSVMNDLSSKENSINLVATHFSLLTKLAEHNDRVANYKVSVNVHDDGQIVYPFKLEPGISHQHVAIDILRNEGVSNHILDQAQGLLRSMVF